jgi:hypothetical protein
MLSSRLLGYGPSGDGVDRGDDADDDGVDGGDDGDVGGGDVASDDAVGVDGGDDGGAGDGDAIVFGRLVCDPTTIPISAYVPIPISRRCFLLRASLFSPTFSLPL